MKEFERVKLLEYPAGGVLDLVIDTDTATEVDDPFAVAYALLSPERLRVQALCAAPFSMNERAQDPADGMEQSYRELLHLLDLLGMREKYGSRVFRGSRTYLAKKAPVPSPAAEELVRLALAHTPERPLYVAAIGAVTNVASALLMQPAIAELMVLVWLAGDDLDATPNVYNVYQDVKAAQVVFDSGVPLVHMPCTPVSSHLTTCMEELEACIAGKNALCDYLTDSVRDYAGDLFAWSKPIWDISVVAYLLSPDFAESELTTSPIVTDNLTWSRDYHRHLIRNVRRLNRDAIFRDLFRKLASLPS